MRNPLFNLKIEFRGSEQVQLLTDSWNDVELVVDLFVHSGGDDADFRESVGHGVNAHLRHEQGEQEDLILSHIVVLHEEQKEKLIRNDQKRLFSF